MGNLALRKGDYMINIKQKFYIMIEENSPSDNNQLFWIVPEAIDIVEIQKNLSTTGCSQKVNGLLEKINDQRFSICVVSSNSIDIKGLQRKIKLMQKLNNYPTEVEVRPFEELDSRYFFNRKANTLIACEDFAFAQVDQDMLDNLKDIYLGTYKSSKLVIKSFTTLKSVQEGISNVFFEAALRP